MQYIILFLEGIITFISPCLLPMLPIYILYFAGDSGEDKKYNEAIDVPCLVETHEGKKNFLLMRYKALINSIGFVIGFSIIFILLGAFAGTVGGFLREYNQVINIVTGAIVILFGLRFLGILEIPFLNGNQKLGIKTGNLKFFSSILFGMVFSIGWTPCVGAFLGSALMLASQQGGTLRGILMLLCYSAGLGVPFIISAVLIDKLKTVFDIIKRNYKTINTISGIFLIVIGVLMMTGFMGYFISLLTF